MVVHPKELPEKNAIRDRSIHHARRQRVVFSSIPYSEADQMFQPDGTPIQDLNARSSNLNRPVQCLGIQRTQVLHHRRPRQGLVGEFPGSPGGCCAPGCAQHALRRLQPERRRDGHVERDQSLLGLLYRSNRRLRSRSNGACRNQRAVNAAPGGPATLLVGSQNTGAGAFRPREKIICWPRALKAISKALSMALPRMKKMKERPREGILQRILANILSKSRNRGIIAVVGDTDLLSDQMWAQTRDIFSANPLSSPSPAIGISSSIWWIIFSGAKI